MTHNGQIRRRPKRDHMSRAKALRILIMESAEQQAAGKSSGSGLNQEAAADNAAGACNPLDPNSEFYNTGRVGRRNALPDILSSHHITTSTADLPDKLNALTTKDEDNASGGGGSVGGPGDGSNAQGNSTSTTTG